MSQTVASGLSNCVSDLHAYFQNHPASFYVLIGAGSLTLVYAVKRKRAGNRGKPIPGPWLPPSAKNNDVDVQQMEMFQKKYGPIFGYNLLAVNTLFLCDIESIKEALVGQPDIFAGRIHAPFVTYVNRGCGVVFIDGPKWQEHRRFALTVLRNFGFGKNITERIIQDELALLLNELASTDEKAVFPRLKVVSAVANVISMLVFGERCGSDPDFEMFVRATTETISSSAFDSILVLLFYRVLMLLPGDYFGVRKTLADVDVLKAFVDRKVDEHRATIDWNNERDLIDAYLVEIRKRDKESPNNHTFTDFQLFRVVFEMYIAGMETTSTTLNWAFLLMAKHPEVQKRVQAEIDSVIGEKLPQNSDRTKLIYTTAVIHEIERFSTLAPFSVPHRTMEDTVLRGYFVPANTIVTPYLFGAHRDPRVWKNPKSFDPSHFYDESTNSLINTHNLIPFSVGKRSCLGESLATQELFVFFTGVLQRFSLDCDASQPLPVIKEDFINSLIRQVPEFKIVFRDRTKSK